MYLATSSQSEEISNLRIWDLTTKELVAEREIKELEAFTVSIDASYIITGDSDCCNGKLKLWQVPSLNPICTIADSGDDEFQYASTIQFAVDGARFLVLWLRSNSQLVSKLEIWCSGERTRIAGIINSDPVHSPRFCSGTSSVMYYLMDNRHQEMRVVLWSGNRATNRLYLLNSGGQPILNSCAIHPAQELFAVVYNVNPGGDPKLFRLELRQYSDSRKLLWEFKLMSATSPSLLFDEAGSCLAVKYCDNSLQHHITLHNTSDGLVIATAFFLYRERPSWMTFSPLINRCIYVQGVDGAIRKLDMEGKVVVEELTESSGQGIEGVAFTPLTLLM
jgi:hypothetical protein